MTWVNPPVPVQSLADMLAASTTWQTLVGVGNYTSHIHYPGANINGEQTTADALPLAVIFHERNRREKFAVGAAGMAQGTLRLVLYIADAIGSVNQTAQSILADLLAMDTGLALRSGECGECSDPLPGQRATQDTGTLTAYYRSVDITLEYGLSV